MVEVGAICSPMWIVFGSQTSIFSREPARATIVTNMLVLPPRHTSGRIITTIVIINNDYDNEYDDCE